MIGSMYRNDMTASSMISISYQEEEKIADKSQNIIINQEGVKKLAAKVGSFFCFFFNFQDSKPFVTITFQILKEKERI